MKTSKPKNKYVIGSLIFDWYDKRYINDIYRIIIYRPSFKINFVKIPDFII